MTAILGRQTGNRCRDPSDETSGAKPQRTQCLRVCRRTFINSMRSITGGHVFSWSEDNGESWSIPEMAPLRRDGSPSDVCLQTRNLGCLNRHTINVPRWQTPLVSTVTALGVIAKLERSLYQAYCYGSCTFIGDRAVLSYMHTRLWKSCNGSRTSPITTTCPSCRCFGPSSHDYSSGNLPTPTPTRHIP